ncbi:MAG: tetratricopeptide repeat protein [Bacteroidota bacterium]
MKNIFCFLLSCFFSQVIFSQNCNAYLYYGDTLQYEACVIAEKRAGNYQFSRAYQEALDEALEKCDYFSHAYRHKSVAYLKSGDFLTWKRLMDKAVELDPAEFLQYRGWCRYQFFRDYQGAIDDIERLDSLVNYDIGFSQNGDYHLHIARGLWYKALGQKDKAIEIIETQLAAENHSPGLYDYLHLGVLYLEINEIDEAIHAFNKQTENYPYAENQFYLGLAQKAKGNFDAYLNHLQNAKAMYLKRERMFDVYSIPLDKIYLQEIEAELEEARSMTEH